MYHLFFANPIAAKYQTQETTLRQIIGHIFFMDAGEDIV
jgi:hypothetical protein